MSSEQNRRRKRPRNLQAAPRQEPAPSLGAISEVAQEDSSAGAPEPALAYLAPLGRLLDLSQNLDAVVRDRETSDRSDWIRTVARIWRALRDEKARLRFVDNSAKTFLECRGGQPALFIGADLRHGIEAADPVNRAARVKECMGRLILSSVERSVAYGIDFWLPNLSDDEKLVLMNWARQQLEPKSRICRPKQLDPNSRLSTRKDIVGSIQALEQALSEHEISVVARELERVSAYLLSRCERSSAEFERRIPREGANEHMQRKKSRRLHAGFVLESERCALAGQAVAGILRCIGGRQRLLMEAARRRNAEPENTIDPEVRKIIERVSEEVMAHADSRPAQRDE